MSCRNFDWLLSRVPFVCALYQLEIWNRLLSRQVKKPISIDLIQMEIPNMLAEGDHQADAANLSELTVETEDCFGKDYCEGLLKLVLNAA